MTGAEVAQSGLQGQREQLEGKLRRQLAEQLEGCTLEAAPLRIPAELEAARAALDELGRRQKEAAARAARKKELDEKIPSAEQEEKKLEQAHADCREALAGAESRKRELAGQLVELRGGLRWADDAAARGRQSALKEEIAGLDKALEAAQTACGAREKELAGLDTAIRGLTELLEGGETIDVPAQQARSQALNEARNTRAAERRTIHTRLTTNQTALGNIRGKAADLKALEARYTWVRALSDTANGALQGKGKVALETYIQMTFFDRILRRANVRFLVMSGGQYELKRRREAEDNRSQSGLELDWWTTTTARSAASSPCPAASPSRPPSPWPWAVRRDPVRRRGHPAGHHVCGRGLRLPGRGVPPAAIRALTGLTEGNRLVGIISHVAELKEKIDKQIVVTKDRTGGSRVEVVV